MKQLTKSELDRIEDETDDLSWEYLCMYADIARVQAMGDNAELDELKLRYFREFDGMITAYTDYAYRLATFGSDDPTQAKSVLLKYKKMFHLVNNLIILTRELTDPRPVETETGRTLKAMTNEK
jgi:hypothetical protein